MNRTGRGQFQKGRSGNAGGRPKVTKSLRIEARKYMELALGTLVEGAKKGSITAACAILDRGYGKPEQAIDLRMLFEKKMSEMTLAELVQLEERLMIAIDEVNGGTDEAVSDDPDGKQDDDEIADG
jgi:hypothetical protein